MITLAQIKTYLKLTETTYDSFLKDCILKAQSHVESYLGWEHLNDTAYLRIYDYSYTQQILDNIIWLGYRAVTSINSWVYYDSDNNETELFTGDNTIANSTKIINDYGVKVYKGIYLGEKTHKIGFNAGYKFRTLTGTVSTVIGDATVTGVGTAFNTELSAGNNIIIGNEKKVIDTITDATHLETTDTFYGLNSGVAITLTTLPDLIRQAMEETTAYTFRESYQGQGTLMLESKSSGGTGVTDSETYKKLDLSYIDRYKNY